MKVTIYGSGYVGLVTGACLAATSCATPSARSYGVIFDGRNLYDPALVARKGLQYYAIGRGAAPPHKEEDFAFQNVALAAS